MPSDFDDLSRRRGAVYKPMGEAGKSVEAAGIGTICPEKQEWERVTGTGSTIEEAKAGFAEAARKLADAGQLFFRAAPGAQHVPITF